MSLKRIITEIGEANTYYDFVKTNHMGDGESFVIDYQFKTPENKYVVYFEKNEYEKAVRVAFNAKDKSSKKIVKPTNEHVTIKVMSTVIQIAKKFNRDNPEYNFFQIKFPWFDKLNTNKRRSIYRKFIKKNFPEAEIKKIFRDLYIEL